VCTSTRALRGSTVSRSRARPRRPAEAELFWRLLRLVELQKPRQTAPVARSWRRELHVLTLNPVENMRLEIRLERDPLFFSTTVNVGVDDVQLAPVLSLLPPLGGPDVLCALLRVPSAAELQIISLQGLVVDDHWRRVHVTVSLETEGPVPVQDAPLHRRGRRQEVRG